MSEYRILIERNCYRYIEGCENNEQESDRHNNLFNLLLTTGLFGAGGGLHLTATMFNTALGLDCVTGIAFRAPPPPPVISPYLCILGTVITGH